MDTAAIFAQEQIPPSLIQATWLEADTGQEFPLGRVVTFSDSVDVPVYSAGFQQPSQRPLFPQAPRYLPPIQQELRPEMRMGIPLSDFQFGDNLPGFRERMPPGETLSPLDGFVTDGAKDKTNGLAESLSAKCPSPSSNITVQIQSDFLSSNQDANSRLTVGELPDGAFFRRARFGVFGEVYERVEYRIEFDFAGEARPRFLDLWVALTDVPIIRNVIIGHFFEPFSLERYSPNRFITFTERSFADTFAPARNMGAMLYGNAFDERVTWALGGFRNSSDDFGSDISFEDSYAITGHATVLPWYEEVGEYNLKLLHLGSSLSYRVPGDRDVRFRTRPSVRLFEQGVGGIPAYVDSGILEDVDDFFLAGLEAAWVHGPISLQAEWISSQVSRADRGNPYFHSGYVYGSWFLTGESRSYSPTSILGRFREGIFQRTVPKTNLFFRGNETNAANGLGAVELAVRWSYIDLNSQDIRGGYMYEMTYGINWYWNPYTKVMFNYVQPQLNDPDLGRSASDFFVARMQFEF